MSRSAEFLINYPGYTIRRLSPEDSWILQTLYDDCKDYMLLTKGDPASATAAIDEFDEVPEGKTKDDKYLFGLYSNCEKLVGVIEAIRHYPDNDTWWIGLLMMKPEYRRLGLGTSFYYAFEKWISTRKALHISLLVIEANKPARKFWQDLGFQIIRKTGPKTFGKRTHNVLVLKKSIDSNEI